LGIKSLFLPGLLVVVPFVLVLKQPDLGTALVIALIAASMVLFIGVERKIIVAGLILLAISVPIGWKYVMTRS
jgi:rod shape determining protein RodA